MLLSPQEEADARAAGLREQEAKAKAPPAPPALGERTDRPPEVFDSKTGQQLQLEPDDAAKAIAAGTAGVVGSATVNVVGPDGQKGSVQGADLQRALAAGFSLESTHQNRINNFLDKNANLASAVGVAGQQALGGLTFGASDAAQRLLSTPEENEKWEALKQQHNVASALGTGVGFGASLLTGGALFGAAGKVGELAEGAASGLGKVASSAARLGAESAVLAAPEVITEATLGDPKAAAEHLAWAVGGGAALGAAGSVAKSAVKALYNGGKSVVGPLVDAVLPAKSLTELSNQQAFKSLMYGTDKTSYKYAEQLPDGAKGLGRYVLDNGLLRNPGERFEDYAVRIGQSRATKGQEIGAAYKELDALGAKGDTAQAIAKQIDEDVIAPLRRDFTRKADVARLEGEVESFKAAAALQNADRGLTADNPMSLYDLWEARKDVAHKARQETEAARKGNLSVGQEELDKIRVVLDKAIERGAKGKLGAGREFSDEIAKLNHDYKHLATLDDIVERSRASEETRRNLSLSDNMALHGGMLAGVHVAGPVGALAGVATGLGHHFLRENGNVIVAKYANQLGVYFAHHAVAEGEQSLARLPRLLSGMAEGMPSAELGALNGFRMLLGDRLSKDHEKNLERAQDKLGALQNDPARATQLQAMTDTLSKGAPVIAQAYRQHEDARLKYVLSQMPAPSLPVPFAPKKRRSKADAEKFNDVLEVAIDPHTILDRLQNGTINATHVKTAKALWPSTYGQIVNSAMQWGLSPKGTALPYQALRRVSVLMGQPVDGPGRNLKSYQAGFVPVPPAPTARQTSGTGGRKLNLPGASLTQNQRIQSR